MTCRKYELHELGKLSSAEFKDHLLTCPECQRLTAEDTELFVLAGSLKKTVDAPLLWDKIENQLRAEKQRQSRFEIPKTWHYALRIAAILLLIFSVSYFFRSEPVAEPSGLLVNSALEKVEEQEQKYLDAISELEQMARPKLSEFDLDLQLLYRDKLETIDNQIARCKNALEKNPANAHIRHYLLAALQDKKNTLREVLDGR